MLISDILHSCANERVAEAAVHSIGGEFADRVKTLARRHEVPVGLLVGRLVRRFAIEAGERDWRGVVMAIAGTDLPVLIGLKSIVETMMRNPSLRIQLEQLASRSSDLEPVWFAASGTDVESVSA